MDAGRPPVPVVARAMAMDSAEAADSYQAADLRFEARVNVSFDLLTD